MQTMISACTGRMVVEIVEVVSFQINLGSIRDSLMGWLWYERTYFSLTWQSHLLNWEAIGEQI